jgi:hypothetical protein
VRLNPIQKGGCMHERLVHDMLIALVIPGRALEASWVLVRTIALWEPCFGYFAALRRTVSAIELK